MSLKAFTPRWWYSIYYDGHSHLSRCSVRHKLDWAAVIRDLRGCHQRREKGIHRVSAFLTFTYPPLAEWNGWHVLSLMGQQVPIWVSSAGRLAQRRERGKKHLIRRLGIGSGKELHAILDQSCRVYFLKEGPSLSTQTYFSGRIYCVKGNMI